MKQYSESPPQTRKAERRSKTFAGSGSYKKPRLSFHNKSPDEAEDVVPLAPLRTKKLKKRTQRSGSQFYDNEDITRRIIEPRDFPELNLKDKGAKELLLMLRPVSCVFGTSYSIPCVLVPILPVGYITCLNCFKLFVSSASGKYMY